MPAGLKLPRFRGPHLLGRRSSRSIRNWLTRRLLRRGPPRRRPDHGRAPGTGAPAAREPSAQDGEGYPLKSNGLVRSGDEQNPREGWKFVSENRASYPITVMCRTLAVSPSGYHAWVKRSPSSRSSGVRPERELDHLTSELRWVGCSSLRGSRRCHRVCVKRSKWGRCRAWRTHCHRR